MTLISRGLPFSSTTTKRTTVPWNFALRASSEYSGSTLKITEGGETPPPMRYAPPPMLPPDPGPNPAPFPDPTPPWEPLPIPAPEPGPLEAIIDFARGSPRTSMLTLGMLASGWMTKVGSITNFGSGLRITAIGGTNCLSDNLG